MLLQLLLNNMYNDQNVTVKELHEFIEFMYKKLNPDKPCNETTVEKLFMVDHLLQMVLHNYISIIENDPTEYGLFYTRIYDKDNNLIKTTVAHL